MYFQNEAFWDEIKKTMILFVAYSLIYHVLMKQFSYEVLCHGMTVSASMYMKTSFDVLFLVHLKHIYLSVY
jgi:hypothetical protein